MQTAYDKGTDINTGIQTTDVDADGVPVDRNAGKVVLCLDVTDKWIRIHTENDACTKRDCE